MSSSRLYNSGQGTPPVGNKSEYYQPNQCLVSCRSYRQCYIETCTECQVHGRQNLRLALSRFVTHTRRAWNILHALGGRATLAFIYSDSKSRLYPTNRSGVIGCSLYFVIRYIPRQISWSSCPGSELRYSLHHMHVPI